MKGPTRLMAACLLFGAGCASLPEPRVYVLTPPAVGAVAGVAERERPRLQLQPVAVPDYLDTTDLLFRSGRHELKVSPSARWAERLSKGLTHALSAALAARLSPDVIDLDQGEAISERQVLVNVVALDLWPDGRCILDARWMVLDKDTRKVLVAEQAVFEIPPAGPGAVNDPALVAAIASAVGKLADRVAEDIQRPSSSSRRPRVDHSRRLARVLGIEARPDHDDSGPPALLPGPARSIAPF